MDIDTDTATDTATAAAAAAVTKVVIEPAAAAAAAAAVTKVVIEPAAAAAAAAADADAFFAEPNKKVETSLGPSSCFCSDCYCARDGSTQQVVVSPEGHRCLGAAAAAAITTPLTHRPFLRLAHGGAAAAAAAKATPGGARWSWSRGWSGGLTMLSLLLRLLLLLKGGGGRGMRGYEGDWKGVKRGYQEGCRRRI